MRKNPSTFSALGALAVLSFTGVAVAQTRPAFEVASIKPSAPLDMAKLAADMQQGKMPKMGAHVDASRAEYNYVAMRDLIVLAYGVKTFQVTGPDWLTKERYDIVAKLPAGSRKEDAPKMLQSLLEDRFKLTFHKTKEEHPVLGLVVGKNGPKLKESTEKPQALDETIPLKPGEMMQEGPDGPVRVTMGKLGSATVNMGLKGTMSYGMNPATQSFHMDGSMITMSGFADMLTQFSQMGDGGGRQVVDMTNLKGNYEVAIDFALADLLQMARANGMDIPMGAGRGPGGPVGGAPSDAASELGGGATSSITQAVSALGLKLEPRKAMVNQLIIDHVEKTATEN
jgi:uncharacterized protein (TIGR03435 family)